MDRLMYIQQAIEACENVPPAAKDMLEAGLCHVDQAEGRHSLQCELLKMVGQTFAAEKETLQKQVNQVQEELEKQAEEVNSLNTEKVEITNLVATSTADYSKMEAVMAEARRTVEASEKEHKSSEASAKKWLSSWKDMRAKLEELATWRELPASRVQEILCECKADKALVAAFPAALSGSARFDGVVVEQVSLVIEKRIGELKQALEDAAPEESALRAELTGLWAIASVDKDAATATEKLLLDLEAKKLMAEASLENIERKIQKSEKASMTLRERQQKLQEQVVHMDSAGEALQYVVQPPPEPVQQQQQQQAEEEGKKEEKDEKDEEHETTQEAGPKEGQDSADVEMTPVAASTTVAEMAEPIVDEPMKDASVTIETLIQQKVITEAPHTEHAPMAGA
mmetsp:Transcript_38772/g.58473  ORF Transcript_38772/g.58473 Transcript_38772/m.58473 type:complete len:398 (-) Transcript_38772:251-1444(-)